MHRLLEGDKIMTEQNDSKKARELLRGEYVTWTHMKKGSKSHISGNEPTEEQIQTTINRIESEEQCLSNIIDRCKLLTDYINQEKLWLKKVPQKVTNKEAKP